MINKRIGSNILVHIVLSIVLLIYLEVELLTSGKTILLGGSRHETIGNDVSLVLSMT